MTPNNKSECCSKCAWQNENRPIHCIDKDCPCHVGDSLRKQEENKMYCEECRKIYTGLSDNYCPDCEIPMVEFKSTPKVATSEKDLECKYYNKCPLKVRGEKCTHHDGGNISMNDGATSEKEIKYSDKTCECKGLENLHFEGQCQFYTSKKKKYAACDNLEAHIPDYNPKNYVPPHESEDWEAELKTKSFFTNLNTYYTAKTLSSFQMDCIDFIRKVYQRGREEGYTEGVKSELDYKNKLDEQNKRVIHNHALSLAVQEIEKEKGESCDDEYVAGLDKAKSIISGVMKK